MKRNNFEFASPGKILSKHLFHFSFFFQKYSLRGECPHPPCRSSEQPFSPEDTSHTQHSSLHVPGHSNTKAAGVNEGGREGDVDGTPRALSFTRFFQMFSRQPQFKKEDDDELVIHVLF